MEEEPAEYKRGSGENPPQDGDFPPSCCSPLFKTRWSTFDKNTISISFQRSGSPDPPPLLQQLTCPSLPSPPSYGRALGVGPQLRSRDFPSWTASSIPQWRMSRRRKREPRMSRRRKRNPGCIRQCLRAGVLHPAQCHFLCWGRTLNDGFKVYIERLI